MTQKLLYILPDVAYVAELLPTKKPNTFAIHSFRQINGEFLSDDDFISGNVVKLFKKLEKSDYHLVLPDFLFTNTIVNVAETSDSKIKTYINDTLLPQLEIDKQSYELETFVLTEFKGVAKVQLSAIEKSLLSPIRVAAEENQVKISAASPLSWTIKSVISLEPSISVLQIGSQLYAAQHYIGVDQATIAPVSEADAVAETIKTLKGAEPSIQTVYLLTNEKVEQELKDLLSDKIPLQQLTSANDENAKMPSYVKQIIESGMRTISISDYPVPKFDTGKPTSTEKQEVLGAVVEGVDDDIEETNTSSDAVADKPLDKSGIDETLPPPTQPLATTFADDQEDDKDHSSTDEQEKEEVTDEELSETTEVTEVSKPEAPSAMMPEVNQESLEAKEEDGDKQAENEPEIQVSTREESLDDAKTDASASTEADTRAPSAAASVPAAMTTTAHPAAQVAVSPALVSSAQDNQTNDQDDDEDVDLSQFAGHAVSAETSREEREPDAFADSEQKNRESEVKTKPKQVIKNKSGVGAMLRMIFITLSVFAVTVALGVGVGLGLISWTSESNQTPSPSPTAQVAPTPEPTPTPTPAPVVVKEDLNILVVNATTKAGYAGTIKADLDEAEYGRVTAANAEGDYETGNFVLMSEENQALVEALSEDTGLSLTFAEGVATEDPSDQYDAVIVLAE